MSAKLNTKAANRIDLLGKKFGKLTVIAEAPTKNKQARWLCSCECGNTKVIIGSKLRRGETKSCGCLRTYPYRWQGCGDINGTYWNTLKQRRNKHKKKTFTITIQQAWEKYLAQDGKCAISGVPITLAKHYYHNKGHQNQTASLDRIDSSQGYTPENTQWVHIQVNLMKHVLSQDKFIEWCKVIVSHQYPLLS